MRNKIFAHATVEFSQLEKHHILSLVKTKDARWHTPFDFEAV